MNTTAMAPLRHPTISATPELVDRVRARRATTGESNTAAAVVAALHTEADDIAIMPATPNGATA